MCSCVFVWLEQMSVRPNKRMYYIFNTSHYSVYECAEFRDVFAIWRDTLASRRFWLCRRSICSFDLQNDIIVALHIRYRVSERVVCFIDEHCFFENRNFDMQYTDRSLSNARSSYRMRSPGRKECKSK